MNIVFCEGSPPEFYFAKGPSTQETPDALLPDSHVLLTGSIQGVLPPFLADTNTDCMQKSLIMYKGHEMTS